MADINVLDLTPTTPGSNDSLILFDRTTGEGKSTRFDTLSGQVLDSKFGDSNPTAGQELSYNPATGKYENTSQIASLNEALTNEVVTRAINGAHNFAPITNVTQEIHGVTFTVGDTVKISGTPDVYVSFRLTEKHPIDVALKGKECKLHYDNSKGDMLYMWIEGYDSSNTKVLDKSIMYNALDTTFTIPSSTETITVAITVRTTYDGALFDVQPMLILASDPSPAVFVPYAKTNRELTVESSIKRDVETNNGISIAFAKINGVVTMNIYAGKTTNALSTGDVLVTVPSGFRPVLNGVRGIFFIGAPNVIYWYDASDNKFKIDGSVTANSSLRGTTTYIAEQ